MGAVGPASTTAAALQQAAARPLKPAHLDVPGGVGAPHAYPPCDLVLAHPADRHQWLLHRCHRHILVIRNVLKAGLVRCVSLCALCWQN